MKDFYLPLWPSEFNTLLELILSPELLILSFILFIRVLFPISLLFACGNILFPKYEKIKNCYWRFLTLLTNLFSVSYVKRLNIPSGVVGACRLDLAYDHFKVLNFSFREDEYYSYEHLVIRDL